MLCIGCRLWMVIVVVWLKTRTDLLVKGWQVANKPRRKNSHARKKLGLRKHCTSKKNDSCCCWLHENWGRSFLYEFLYRSQYILVRPGTRIGTTRLQQKYARTLSKMTPEGGTKRQLNAARVTNATGFPSWQSQKGKPTFWFSHSCAFFLDSGKMKIMTAYVRWCGDE